MIIKALIASNRNIAQIWNSNFYFSDKTMIVLKDIIDLWLPDLKYGSNKCARRLSNINNYYEIVTNNIKKAYLDCEKKLSSIIIRHLMLPNHFECCTKPILEWISKEVPKAHVNIMDQYRPCHLVFSDRKYEDITRRLTRIEVKKAYDFADELGLIWREVTK
jgi:putative pyruvate formate lyase activating enzyme